jgi:hypothetical protein
MISGIGRISGIGVTAILSWTISGDRSYRIEPIDPGATRDSSRSQEHDFEDQTGFEEAAQI